MRRIDRLLPDTLFITNLGCSSGESGEHALLLGKCAHERWRALGCSPSNTLPGSHGTPASFCLSVPTSTGAHGTKDWPGSPSTHCHIAPGSVSIQDWSLFSLLGHPSPCHKHCNSTLTSKLRVFCFLAWT